MTHQELTIILKKLTLHTVAKEYAEIARIAEKKSSTYEQYLASVANVEMEARTKAKINRLIYNTKLPLAKTIEAFDFTRISGLSELEFKRLAQGDFVRAATNIVLYGTFGAGKTHLAIALARKLCEIGIRCYFTTLHGLIEQLLEAKTNLQLAALYKRLDKNDLLIIDELGYTPQTQDGADLFFQLISQRNERKSILITTNLVYSEWEKVFLNPLSTAAAVDRVIGNCETYNIKAPSFRSENAKKRNDLKKTLTVTDPQ